MHIIYGVHYNFRHRYTVNIFHFSQEISVVAGKEKKKILIQLCCQCLFLISAFPSQSFLI